MNNNDKYDFSNYKPTIKEIIDNCKHQDGEISQSYFDLLILHKCICPINKIIHDIENEVGWKNKHLVENKIKELFDRIFIKNNNM